MKDDASEPRGQFPNLTRRQFLGASGASAAGLLLAKNTLLRPDRSLAREQVIKNALGASLPTGAASLSSQFLVSYESSQLTAFKALDFYETVYSRAPNADNFDIALVRITPDFKIVPGSATHWAQTSPTTWEFSIMPGIMWSDGNELTANDFVETFRYSADPKHAWDFAWYWGVIGIKNYADAVAGKAPVNSIGVSVGKTKYTFVVTTEAPVAYMPNAMLYSMPLSAAGLAKYGSGLYNIDPGTCISCGPYILTKFNPTSEVVLGPNPKYTAPYKPDIQYQIAKIYNGGDYVPLLDTGVVDYNPRLALSKTDLAVAKGTPGLSKLKPYLNAQDFRVYYVWFKTKAAPFNNLKVRQAFAHAVNRDQIINALLKPLALPAYGYLMPGFPFSVSQPLEKYTNYDPELAQKLLAEAGYPKGKGFPTVEFAFPANVGALDPTTVELVVQAISDGWNQTLFGGATTLLLQQFQTNVFVSKMENKPEPSLSMGLTSYGMDYLDASNMMSVYAGGGRHDWDNAQYDNLLAQGAAQSNHAQRQEIYTEAQTLLTSQAPGVFMFFGLDAYLMWPYVTGPALAPNYLGYNGLEWPGFFAAHSTNQEGIYIANNVGKYPRQSESGQL